MAELEGLEPDGRGVAAGDERRRRPGAGRDPGHRRAPEDLGVEGEERLRGRGVSHCASCDAPLMRDRTVGVVGGGDSALQEALTLAEAVGEVIVLHRGDALSAQAAYREPVLAHPKIDVRYGTWCRRSSARTPSAACAPRALRRAATPSSSSAASSSTSGWRPTAGTSRPARPRRRRAGPDRRRAADRLPGVFAAGIVRRGSLGQAAISAGEGAAAAKAAHRYLDGRATGIHAHSPRRERRLTWLRSSPSTTRADIRRRSPASRSPRGCRASRASSVYLVDCLFDNSEAFVDAAAALVRRAHAGGRDQARSRRARAGSTTPRCARAVVADGDAAILGVGL